MTSGSEGSPSLYASRSAAFELERFGWSGPDRLEVAGRFAGLADGVGEAVLVVRGSAGAQELAVVPGSVSGGSADGDRWRAQFAWPAAPTAFDAAELRIGDALVVELPDPPGRRRPFARRHLEVRHGAREDEPAAEAVEAGPAAPEEHPAPQPAEADPGAATAQLRLQAQLLVAREEAREIRGELERAQEDLAATRTALESERERHAADAEQFRQDFAEVQAAAEEAVAAAHARVAELEAAAGEADALRARIHELDAAAAEAEALRARIPELEAAAGEAEALRAQAGEHERLRTAVGEARAALATALDRLPAAPDG